MSYRDDLMQGCGFIGEGEWRHQVGMVRGHMDQRKQEVISTPWAGGTEEEVVSWDPGTRAMG